MAQTQLHGRASSELPGRGGWPLIVPVLFTCSSLLVIYYVVADIVFGVKYFYQWSPVTTDVQYTLLVWSVFLAVPLAAILAGVGAAIATRIPKGRLWLMVGVLMLALVAPLIAGFFVSWNGGWPPWVFGGGGVLIITSVLLTCWFWAEVHAKPHSVERPSTDLRLFAYVLFGIAAYWT